MKKCRTTDGKQHKKDIDAVIMSLDSKVGKALNDKMFFMKLRRQIKLYERHAVNTNDEVLLKKILEVKNKLKIF